MTDISADGTIPQCRQYQQMLANENLKKKFIAYIMNQFIKFGTDSNLSINIILDYEEIECPCAIYEVEELVYLLVFVWSPRNEG